MDHYYISYPSYRAQIGDLVYPFSVKRYKTPPVIPAQEELDCFADGVLEIIPSKLQDLMERQDQILKKYNQDNEEVDRIVKAGKVTKIEEYILTYLTELDFIEYTLINKWLRYYLRLAAAIAPETSWVLQMQDEKDLTPLIGRAKAFPIEELYEGDLRVNGDRLIGRCPFHKENTPSFVIFRHDNHFYCFGCHKHGDVIDFYMLQKDTTSLPEAVKALAR